MPVLYSDCAIFPAVSSRSVDLPIPGSPASRITAPGTMPPPRTRSNSVKPVGMRITSSRPVSVTGRSMLPFSASVSIGRMPLPERGEALILGSWNSSIVPHSPQLGHLPYHFEPFHPHSEQTYCGAVFAIVCTLLMYKDIPAATRAGCAGTPLQSPECVRK